ncbi:MAG TPA: hypothetical protein VJQ85_05475 [Gaiellaceae bacterium]|nr:hypothetical protein [Gaiellaceae bacterium]
MLKRLVFATCAAGASLVVASGAPAANSPVPVPGAASCQGNLIAISNHSSGPDGSNASAGPGYFLHSSTHDAIVEYVDGYCG